VKRVVLCAIALFPFLSYPLCAIGAEWFPEQYRAYQSAKEKGKGAFERKDYPTVVVEYSKVIALSPFDTESYFLRGVALFKSGREKEAIADLDKALLINPRLV
jgi:tetratricopeptide (TPR) repeat protein